MNSTSNTKETVISLVYLYLGILLLGMRIIGSSSFLPVVGVAFVIVTAIYMIINLRKIIHKPLSVKIVTGIMCIAFVIMSETGIMIMLQGMDDTLRTRHVLAGVVFLISMVYHVVQHKKKNKIVQTGFLRNRIKRLKK
jgi:hypothetical protein